MAPGLLVFYGIALAIILGGGLAVFLALRRRGRVLAAVTGALASAALVLVWPLPIHGGFTLLGGALYDEWARDRQRTERAHAVREQWSYLESLAARFAAELPILDLGTPSGSWRAVTYAPEGAAWLDTANGQIWSEWLPLPGGASTPSLEVAKRRCRDHAPAGYWSLPTEAEHALMWKAGGAAVLPASDAGSVSYTVDADLRMEIATYRVGSAAPSRAGAARRFAVRCVARGPGGPARGFIRQDVTLADWNRYQVAKAM